MGCYVTDGSTTSLFTVNTNHCDVWRPSSGGVTIQFGSQYQGDANKSAVYEHPATWPIEEDKWCRDCIPYQDTMISTMTTPNGTVSSAADGAGDQGIQEVKSINGMWSSQLSIFPSDLSLEAVNSDEWFYYLFDTANHKNGIPCYLLKTTTTETTSTDPADPTATETSSETSTEKIPMDCPCDPQSTMITYTTPDDTKDSSASGLRDKYPTLWTAHTTSMSVAFEYSNPPTGPGAKTVNGIRKGDTINGWTVADIKHGSLYFNKYHIIELEGSGNDFTYNGTYTSLAGPNWAGMGISAGTSMHPIRVKAGQGIKDKAMLVGRFEFRKKEIQYMVGKVRKDMKTGWNYEIREPVMTPTILAGRIVSVTIDYPGEGYEKFYPKPEIYATPPEKYSVNPKKYRAAKFKATWNGGQLASVEVIDGGFGYSGGADAPSMGVQSADKIEVRTTWNDRDPKSNKTTEIYNKINEQLDNDQRKIVFGDQSASEITEKLQYVNQKYTSELPIDAFQEFEYDETRVREHFLEKQKSSQAAIEPVSVNPVSDAVAQYMLSSDDDKLVAQGAQYRDLFEELNEIEKFHQLESITEEKKAFYKEQKKYTVIGTFFDLPCATNDTKYILKQFKNDMREFVNANVTLSIDVGDCEGCPSMDYGAGLYAWECPCGGVTGSYAGVPSTPPVAGPSGTYPDEDETPYTSTTSTTITGPHGIGCQSWSISSKLKIFNNLTSSAETWGWAIKAFGNPYDFLCPNINTPTIEVPDLQ